MSLPRYVVNMEEGLPYITPDLEGDKENVVQEEGIQRSKGFMLNSEQKTVQWVVDRPSIITGINLATNKESCIGLLSSIGDTIDLKIEGTTILDNRYILYQNDYISFRSFQAVEVGTAITINFNPLDEHKQNILWVDIDYIGDPLLQGVNVLCKEEGSDKLLQANAYTLSKGKFGFFAPEIKGYVPINTFQEVRLLPVYGDLNEPYKVEFFYKRGER